MNSPLRLLLVEDEPAYARLVREFLRPETRDTNAIQFQITHVARLSDALTQLQENAYDLGLLDLSLPDSFGLDAFRQIHAAAPRLAIIILSGNADESIARQAVQEGAQDYLAKDRADEYVLSRAAMYAVERHRAEERTRENEQRYRRLLEDMPDAIFLHQAGRFVYVNAAAVKLLGASEPRQVIGKSLFDFVPPDLHAQAHAQMHQAIELGQSLPTSQEKLVRLDGATLDLEVTTSVIVWDGVPTMQKVARDITERKRIERTTELRLHLLEYAALHSLEELLQETLDRVCEYTSSPIGFYHFVESDGKTLSLQAWSTRTLQEFCHAAGKGLHYPLEQAGVWADCVRQERPVIHNDYASLPNRRGLPEGHAEVIRELVVPILRDGQPVAILGVGNKATAYDENEIKTVSFLADVAWEITRLKRMEYALRDSERQYRILFNEMESGFALHEIICNAQGVPADYRFLSINPAFETLTGLRAQDIVGKTVLEVLPETEAYWIERYGRVALTGEPAEFEDNSAALGKDFEVRAFSPEPGKFAVLFHDITKLKMMERELRKLSRAVEQSPASIVITNTEGAIEYVNPRFVQLTGYAFDNVIGKNPRVLKSGHTAPHEYQSLWRTIKAGEEWRGEFLNKKKNGELFWESALISPVLDESGQIKHFVAIKEEITERKQRERELQVVATVATALRKADTDAEILRIVLEQSVVVFEAPATAYAQYDTFADKFMVQDARGAQADAFHAQLRDQTSFNTELLTHAMNATDAAFAPSPQAKLKIAAMQPLVAQERTHGVLFVARAQTLSESETRILNALCDMTANALHRARLYEQTKHQLERLALLHAIDSTIVSSLDLDLTLHLICEQITARLRIDTAAAYLMDAQTMRLECRATLGVHARALKLHLARKGETYAQHIASERKTLYMPDVKTAAPAFRLSAPFELPNETFAAYCGMPLIAKGQVKGVLELYHHAPLPADLEWLDFLNTLAQQAAIAIDNIELFENLQRTNLSLALAYDSTIEGWSRVLDLRDKETEGHSLRVTALTIELAQCMGFSTDEIVNLRRGALLHDIGKMGVPDEILLKPAPLDENEWIVMRKHPQYAFDMLMPIEYLRSALDIPHYHHERWDGSGYPFGLKGQAIPLAARIFAVVDVWDALTSNRPYRKAWSPTQAREYLRAEAGKLFDPMVVEIFLERVVPGTPSL